MLQNSMNGSPGVLGSSFKHAAISRGTIALVSLFASFPNSAKKCLVNVPDCLGFLLKKKTSEDNEMPNIIAPEDFISKLWRHIKRLQQRVQKTRRSLILQSNIAESVISASCYCRR